MRPIATPILTTASHGARQRARLPWEEDCILQRRATQFQAQSRTIAGILWSRKLLPAPQLFRRFTSFTKR
jgi:hypothetical protein